jgi:hypothetical protein
MVIASVKVILLFLIVDIISNFFWKCLKQVGKRYSRVKIREIYLSKTRNLGIQTNVMNTEKKFTEQEKHTIYIKMNQIGFI